MAIQTLFKILILVVFGLYILKYALGAFACVILLITRNNLYNRLRMTLDGIGPGFYVLGLLKSIVNLVLLLLVGGILWLFAERFITV